MYRFEMHLHAAGCSKCGSSECTAYMQKAKALGYAGMVFTNHFYHGNTGIDRALPWKEFVYAYRDDYLRAREAGERLGLTVLFGLEEGIGGGREALIYGLSAETIADCEAFRDMTTPEMSAFVRGNGGFFALAHPFRHAPYISVADTEPQYELFDAFEIYNHGNSEEDNLHAVEFAKQHSIPGIAGGDVHHVDGFGFSGLDFERPILTNEDLVREMKAGRYSRFCAKWAK